MRPSSWLVGALLLFCSCTTEPAGSPGIQSDTPCEDIIAACHEKDDGTPGALNDCHQVGHDDVAQSCSDQLATCLQTCNDAAPVADTEHEDDSSHEDDEDDGETTIPESTSTGGDPPDATTGEAETGEATTSGGGDSSSSTGSDSSADANCSDLGSECHDVPGEVALMCHDVGHDGNEPECAAIWLQCKEACGF